MGRENLSMDFAWFEIFFDDISQVSDFLFN